MAFKGDILVKSSSQKVVQTLQRELKKLSPIGASQRQFYARNKLPKAKNDLLLKSKYNYSDGRHSKKSPVFDYLEPNQISDKHIRSPYQHDYKRKATLSPANLPLSPRSPEKLFDQVGRRTPKFFMEDWAGEEEKKSPKIEAVKEIMDACDTVKSPREVQALPKAFKHYTRKITKLVDGIDNFISKSKQSPYEKPYENEDFKAKNKELEKRLINEFYTKDREKDFVETELAGMRIKREIMKHRDYSAPKQLN